MKRITTLLASILMVANCVLFAQTTFKNPILTGMNPDPSICRVGDDFYLVTSTFEYFPGLPIYHSKDLVNWKLIGHALTTPKSNPLKGANASYGGQYAPTLRYHDGTFYVIGTNYGGEGSQGISYVSAKDPAGPWSDPIWIGEWYVDPSLEFIDDTVYYLSPDNAGSFLLGTIDIKTGKFIEPLRKVASGLGGSAPEGPHFYKVNDYYYIMSAEGGTGYEHREVIQRSKSPWGPYEPSPINPVLSNMSVPQHPFHAIGHADFVQLKDGSWWAVCLGIRPQNGKFQHLGRETFLAPITWNANGWPKVGTDGIVREEFPRPNLPVHAWEKDPVRDDFDGNTLNLYWNFLRNPYAKDWSLTEKPGYLRLKGSELNFSQNDSPAFIGRRQTAFDITASAKVNFTPVADNEEAGLVVRADDKNHYDLFITRYDGKKVVMLRKYLQDKVAEVNYKEIPDGDIVLRITATTSEYKFWVQKEGKETQLIGTATTKDVSNEKVGGFTGVFIGMYASGNGKVNTNPADFDWFELKGER
ncbi:glycoside hydrolase family 43 protein [Bacteroides sp. UBA939]|uniref:glycoside hydrolase family 43 protein n=1 Tax=Bacteroides sp. UBA939 TaxID=1946092 RepID=UPI0025BAEF78|nr:glycoside hydrolase family 43 protein [Bacteroides sp. UBA939]